MYGEFISFVFKSCYYRPIFLTISGIFDMLLYIVINDKWGGQKSQYFINEKLTYLRLYELKMTKEMK